MLLSDWVRSLSRVFPIKNVCSASEQHLSLYYHYLHINYCFALSWHIHWRLKGQVFFELLSLTAVSTLSYLPNK